MGHVYFTYLLNRSSHHSVSIIQSNSSSRATSFGSFMSKNVRSSSHNFINMTRFGISFVLPSLIKSLNNWYWLSLNMIASIYMAHIKLSRFNVLVLCFHYIMTKLICQWFKLHKNELVYLCNMTTVGIPRRRERVREQDAVVLIHIKLICIVWVRLQRAIAWPAPRYKPQGVFSNKNGTIAFYSHIHDFWVHRYTQRRIPHPPPTVLYTHFPKFLGFYE
jgi:hypothetical protein